MGLFSSITSLFKKKKDEQNQTPAPNMSYARQSNPYVSSNLFSSASKTSAPKIDMSKYDFSTPKTAGASAQLRTQPSTPTRTAPRPQTTIQGSGMSSNYASNPNNYKAPTPRTSIAPSPKTTQNTGTTMADLFNKQAASNQASRDRRVGVATNQNDAYVDQIRGSYNRANEQLTSQIPFLQGESDRTKAELLAAAEDIRKSGMIQKDATEETYGDALRQGAQTGREQEKKLKNLFASLGTLDSSQFKNEMINTTEETTRGQQQTLRAKAREISAIEATVQEAERKAQLTVASEVAKFNETIRKINETVGMNEQAKEEEIRNAYAGLQATLTDIEDTLSANQMTLEQAKFDYSQEQQKLAQAKPGYGLSEGFMNTGVPETPEEEYILRQGETAAQSVINGYLTLNDISDPNIKAIAQDIVAQSGMSASTAGGGGKVAAKDLNIAQTGIQDVGQLRQIFEQNPNQAKTTKVPFAGQTYDTLINNVTDKIGRLRSGGAINKEEEARFKELLPTFWDKPETVQFKLDQLEREFQGLAGMA